MKAQGNAELENRPRMPKESKWAKDAQEERNGTKEPTSNVKGQESPKLYEYKSNDHIESLREEHAAGPKEASKHRPNNTTVEMAGWYGKKGNKITEGLKNGLKRGKPIIKQGPALERSKPIKKGKLEINSRNKRSRMSGRIHR